MADSNVATLIPTADIAFVGGKVVTVNSKDEVTEAVSIRGKHILRVGSRSYVEKTIGRERGKASISVIPLLKGAVQRRHSS